MTFITAQTQFQLEDTQKIQGIPPPLALPLGSILVHMTAPATDMREKARKRAGWSPVKGFDAEAFSHISCPSDHPNLHELFCRKILKDIDLPAVLLRISAQIRETGSIM
jgi:hypothetical protein